MEEKQMKDKWQKGEKWKPSTTSQTGVITSFEGFSKTRFTFEDKKTQIAVSTFFITRKLKSMRETCSPSTVIWFPLLMHVFFLTEARGGGILDYHHIYRLVIYLFSFISISISISGRQCRLHVWQPLVRWNQTVRLAEAGIRGKYNNTQGKRMESARMDDRAQEKKKRKRKKRRKSILLSIGQSIVCTETYFWTARVEETDIFL